MIELRNVTFSYNGREVFHDLNLTVAKGGFVVLIGDTGSGKTTLTKLLIGEILPSNGEVIVGQIRVDTLSKTQLAQFRRSIGFIFEEITLLDEKTVEENIALPLAIGRYRKNGIRLRIEEQLKSVHLLSKAKHLPRELSLGERQRTAIARALVTEPLLLVADSVTSQLDTTSSLEVLTILNEQNISGMTILLTMPELVYQEVLPKNTQYLRLIDGRVQYFLPETPE